jgi:hypothetical protein
VEIFARLFNASLFSPLDPAHARLAFGPLLVDPLEV